MKKKKVARVLLGSLLLLTGTAHLTFARKALQAQVPDWVPLPKDDTVVYSGWVELALGSSLLLANQRQQPAVGKSVAAFFTAIFPGNVSQFVNRRDMPGLDTDAKRFVRLFFQPVLVYWALKSTQRSGG